MRRINRIFIHCSAGYGNVAAIKRFWKETLGWKQVGYHYFIYIDGKVERLAPLATVTNGVGGYNADSIHISYQGGVDPKNYNKAVDTRTPEQKAAILSVLQEVFTQLKETQEIDHIKILGHRDVSKDKNGNGVIEPWERIKECPSFDAKPEYAWLTGTKALNSLTYICMALLCCIMFSSCGTRKATNQSNSELHQASEVKKEAISSVKTETTHYGGDTQKGVIPLPPVTDRPVSGKIESSGITFDYQISNGQLTYQAAAKPVARTASEVTVDSKTDSTGTLKWKVREKEKVKESKPPWWLWLLLLLAVAAFVLFIFKKFSNPFKFLKP